jgi:triose/dihydroxyacetone kinase / FAD-AMP lyase (cyclizing)
VLDAIAAVGGRAGVLLVVKNYTGDRLSFGLAATRAKVRAYRAHTVGTLGTCIVCCVFAAVAHPGWARAQGLDIPVEMVLVGDDCALPASPDRTTGRRGLAGTLLVHKIAGHAAHQGATLEWVAALARAVAGNLGTANVALSACALPGRPPSFALHDLEIELGLGIHGEPGYRRVLLGDVHQVCVCSVVGVGVRMDA